VHLPFQADQGGTQCETTEHFVQASSGGAWNKIKEITTLNDRLIRLLFEA
jgi:hypothetical protein